MTQLDQLAEQCQWRTFGVNGEELASGFDYEKFAQLVVGQCQDICRQEWYTLNNQDPAENETARDVGFRVGTKTGVMRCINLMGNVFK